MDIILPIILVLVFFILFSICGWCCKRKQQGVVFGQGGTPITVTTQPANASPVVIAPYPIEPQHPVPQIASSHHPPPMGFTYQGGYPPAPSGTYPGVYAPAAPASGYPPSSYAPPQSAPPPYHEAVMQQPPSMQVTNEGYMKQAPYNPNY